MDKISKLIHYSRALYNRRLVHASGGNTSVRDEDTVWITETGAVLGELTRSNLSQVDMQGHHLAGNTPSKELGMRLAMYHARPEVCAIVHVHPTNAIAYSTLVTESSFDFVPVYTAAFYMRAGQVPMTDYYASGSTDLHHAVAELAPYYHAIVLRQHGVLVGAGSMSQAMGILEEIEQCCCIALLTEGKGMVLTEAQKVTIDKKLGRTWTK